MKLIVSQIMGRHRRMITGTMETALIVRLPGMVLSMAMGEVEGEDARNLWRYIVKLSAYMLVPFG